MDRCCHRNHRPIWAVLRDRVEARGLRIQGQVRVSDLSRAERHAVSALIGRPVTTSAVAVDLKPYKRLKKFVSLAQIKGDKRLANMALVRLGRLSVQPVTDKEWAAVMELAGEK